MLNSKKQLSRLEQQVAGLQREIQQLTQLVQHRILPNNWIAVPRNPSIEQLTSMAMRSDHGLGLPGYYDQPMFGSDISHDDRLCATITSMRQLYEEATGQGFCQLPKLD
jgi:hypothetical protein